MIIVSRAHDCFFLMKKSDRFCYKKKEVNVHKLYKNYHAPLPCVAQSAGSVEYIDCISAKGQDHPMSISSMAQNNLMVRL